MLRFIFFFLSKRLLSYLIFGAYLIFRSTTPGSLHARHTPPARHILGYRVFTLFIFQHGTLILVHITDSRLSIKVAYSKLYIP